MGLIHFYNSTEEKKMQYFQPSNIKVFYPLKDIKILSEEEYKHATGNTQHRNKDGENRREAKKLFQICYPFFLGEKY